MFHLFSINYIRLTPFINWNINILKRTRDWRVTPIKATILTRVSRIAALIANVHCVIKTRHVWFRGNAQNDYNMNTLKHKMNTKHMMKHKMVHIWTHRNPEVADDKCKSRLFHYFVSSLTQKRVLSPKVHYTISLTRKNVSRFFFSIFWQV